MKLYRVVTDIQTTRFDDDFFEYIYYLGGYTMFYDSGEDYSSCNNIARYQKEKNAKYFFVFPEDAVCFREKFTHGLIGHILEYEFDDNKLPKLFGMGDYTEDGPINYDSWVQNPFPQNCSIDVLAQESEFTGDKTYSCKLSAEEKDDMLYKMYVNTQNVIYGFQKINGGELLSKDDYLKEAPQVLGFYRDFHSNKDCYRLIKSKEITGKVYGFLAESVKLEDGLNYSKCFRDYLEKMGLRLDYSDEAKKDRKAIKEECGYYFKDAPEEYFEKVKRMVSEYNTRYNR